MVINQFLAYCHNSIQTDLIFVKVHEPPPLYDGWGFLSLYLENRIQVPVFFSVPQSAAQAVGLQQAPLRYRPPQAETSSRDAGAGESGMNTRCQELLYKTPLLLQSRSAAVIPYGGLPLPVCSEKRYKQKMHRSISAPVRCLVRRKGLEPPTF